MAKNIRWALLAAAVVAMAVSAEGRQEKDAHVLYVQCAEGLKWYAVDGRTGALTPKGELATPRLSPSYLRPSPDGKTLYAAASDRLLAFSIGADGALARTGEAPVWRGRG